MGGKTELVRWQYIFGSTGDDRFTLPDQQPYLDLCSDSMMETAVDGAISADDVYLRRLACIAAYAWGFTLVRLEVRREEIARGDNFIDTSPTICDLMRNDTRWAHDSHGLAVCQEAWELCEAWGEVKCDSPSSYLARVAEVIDK